MDQLRRTPVLIGAILIAVGLITLVGKAFALGDVFVIVPVALVLLVAYLVRRDYVFLALGLISLGAGIGTGLQDYGYDEKGGLVAILSGAGFLAVYLADVLTGTTRRWWPVIPGAILVAIGAVALADGTPAEQWVERLWPVTLIVAGIVVVLAARRGPSGMGAGTRAAGR